MAHQKTASMHRRSRRSKVAGVIAMIVLLLGGVLILIPLLWTFSMALKPDSELYTANFFPMKPEWDNFYRAITQIDFFLYLRNTLMIVIPNVIGTVFSSALVGYGFSRFNFKGKRTWFLILLATMMLPGQVTMIPSYLIYRQLGWVNTVLPLVVPCFFGGGAFNIFLIRQFMAGIPKDFDEAARIDGASSFKIFTKVIMPMTRPAMTAVGIFTFMGTWNDFNGPLIYLYDSDKYTLALGLAFFKGLYTSKWNLMMAATVVVMLPVLILFFCAQDLIIDGISISSGTKG
ncbi:MAG: carbohydrate ABC transporter permease [Lachnospiraceae bacterium]|jgi:multiple sugar transport system permease protein